MPRVLLLVPSATYRAGDFLDAAAALGAEVVVGGEQLSAMADVGSARALQVPLGDPEAAAAAIVDHDARAPIDAVVAVDDQGTVTAALAAARLGLRANPADAVAAACDKLEMRRRLERAEVPQPAFVAVPDDLAPAAAAALAAGRIGFPCVVKPRTLSGSRGVLRADDEASLVAALDRVRAIAAGAGVASGEGLLVERFAPGPEVALEGMLHDGTLEVLAVFDKPDPLDGPAFEETIYVTPSRLDAGSLHAAGAATQAALRALGLVDGPVHAELRVHQGRATVIEVAARTIGGLCARTLRFATGHSLEELVLAHALGIPAPSGRDEGAAGVLMLPAPSAGTLLGVDGTDRALTVPGVTGVEITTAPGRRVAPAPDAERYLGFVFARAAHPEAVVRALRRAWSVLEVRVERD
jgi:biotin carboxylase